MLQLEEEEDMDSKLINTLKDNLEKRHFRVSVFDTKEEAAGYLQDQIQDSTVGIGGSVTAQQMDLYNKLSEKNKVVWHWMPPEGKTPDDVRVMAMTTENYICSVNGAAATGELIFIDGAGNRVGAVAYGHKKVWLVIGENKIAEDFDKALWRARNIAAPKNTQRLKPKTPCAIKGDHCYNCSSPERICNILQVLWNKPMGMDYEIILIREELGY